MGGISERGSNDEAVNRWRRDIPRMPRRTADLRPKVLRLYMAHPWLATNFPRLREIAYCYATIKIDIVRIPLFHVDAFTEQPFRGNPAGVCFLDSWLDEDQLRKVAAENNLSETAFLVPNKAGYELRW